jgi:hypothetical protein
LAFPQSGSAVKSYRLRESLCNNQFVDAGPSAQAADQSRI